MLPNVAPASLLALKYMSLLLAVLACHTRYTLLPDVDICGRDEKLVLLLTSAICPKDIMYIGRDGTTTTNITRITTIAIVIVNIANTLFSDSFWIASPRVLKLLLITITFYLLMKRPL